MNLGQNTRRHEDEKVLERERRKAIFDYIKMDQHKSFIKKFTLHK
jgi:hypothetical protein